MKYNFTILTDEEIYALGIIDVVGEKNITDEELITIITRAKNNQTFSERVEYIKQIF